ncbi:MAG: hypothetical protein CUN56_16290, partial [Phototrophicales bacterium]
MTVSYDKTGAGANKLKDGLGLEIASFTDYGVVNKTMRLFDPVSAVANGGVVVAEDVVNNNGSYGLDVYRDVDGDGVVDVIYGDRYDDTDGTDAGAWYLAYMNVDGAVKSTVKYTKANVPGL